MVYLAWIIATAFACALAIGFAIRHEKKSSCGHACRCDKQK